MRSFSIPISRRDFVKMAGLAAAGAFVGGCVGVSAAMAAATSFCEGACCWITEFR